MTQRKKRGLSSLSNLMGLHFLASFSQRIGRSARDLIKPKAKGTGESFEQAVQRLNLAEADLAKRARQFLQLTYAFAFFAFVVLIYAIHLLISANYHAAILCLVGTVIILTQVFRFHFWYVQIKKRKLNCSFKEWLRS